MTTGVSMKNVNIIIPAFNGGSLLKTCVKKLAEKYPETGIIVVDDCSADNAVKELAGKHKNVRLFFNEKRLYEAETINRGIRNSDAELLVIMNQDAEPAGECLDILISKLTENRNTAIVAPSVYDEKCNFVCTAHRKNISVYTRFPEIFLSFVLKYDSWKRLLRNKITTPEAVKPTYVKDVTGICFAARKRLIKDAGYYDPEFLWHFCDADLCYRIIKRGHKILYAPEARAIHYFSRGNISDIKYKINDKICFVRLEYYFFRKFYGKFRAGLILLFRVIKSISVLFASAFLSRKTISPEKTEIEKGFLKWVLTSGKNT